jgi:hypothetical protein
MSHKSRDIPFYHWNIFCQVAMQQNIVRLLYTLTLILPFGTASTFLVDVKE